MRKMKDSGIEWIGEIPKEWSVCRFRNVVSIYNGDSIKDEVKQLYEDPINAIPYIATKDLDATLQMIDYNNGMYIKLDDDSFKRAPSNSILLCIEGGSAGKKIAFTNREVCFINKLCCFYSSVMNNKYIYYYMLSGAFTEEFKSHISGLIGGVSINEIKSFSLLLPSKDEQHKIADYLDKQCSALDDAIAKTRDSITEYKKLKQAVITQAVTKGVRGERAMKDSENIWFGNIPADWEMKKIKYLFQIRKDIAGEEGHTVLSITQKGVIPKDLSKNEGQIAESYSNYQLVSVGDFAMNHMDLLTGWIDISKYDGVTSPDYRVFKLVDIENCFAQYYLYLFQMCYSNRIFYGLGQGVSGMGRWRLQADKFLNFSVSVPSLEEQEEIVTYLNERCAAIDALIAQKEQYVVELENYKKSLIYEYVTGKKEVSVSVELPLETLKALMMCRMIEIGLVKGRVQLAKGLFLADNMLGINNTTQYARYVHGPYDKHIEDYEKVLMQNGWVNVKTGSPIKYFKAEKFEEYRKLYNQVYSAIDNDVQRICAFLSPMKTSQAERVATLFAVWNDFILDGIIPTDKQIVDEVRTNWTANKANSSEETWLGTLDKMKKNNIVPSGKGLHTIRAL